MSKRIKSCSCDFVSSGSSLVRMRTFFIFDSNHKYKYFIFSEFQFMNNGSVFLGGEKARITTVGRQVSSLDGFVNITSYVGDNITSLTGSDLTIYCPTEGIPEPVVSWSRGGAPLRSDRRYTVNPFTNALRIRKLRREDSGGFTCSARNNRGGDQKTSFLNVIGELATGCDSAQYNRRFGLGRNVFRRVILLEIRFFV